MDTIAKLRRWLESIRPTSPDCPDDDPTIIVVSADVPPERRYCFSGGDDARGPATVQISKASVTLASLERAHCSFHGCNGRKGRR